MKKFLLALLLIPTLAFGQNEQAIRDIMAMSPTSWFKSYYGSTITTARGVSAARDFSGNSRTFAQATVTSQPIYTRQDNRENLVIYSEDISKVSASLWWTYTRSTNISALEFKEDGTAANTHYVEQALPLYPISGRNYTLKVRIKRGAGARNAQIMINRGSTTPWMQGNLGTCAFWDGNLWVTRSVGVDPDDASYCLFQGVFTSDGTGAGWVRIYLLEAPFVSSYNGDNTSSIYVTKVELRSADADAFYTKTAAGPEYRGVNGLPGNHFDGIYKLVNTLGGSNNLFTNNAKHIFAVIRIAGIGTPDRYFFGQIAGSECIKLLLRTNGKIRFEHYDGTLDVVDSATTYTDGALVIVEAKHEGGNIYIRTNGDVEQSIASGNTTGACMSVGSYAMLGASATTQAFRGDITEFLTFNTALTPTNRQKVYDYLSWTLNNPWKRVEVTP